MLSIFSESGWNAERKRWRTVLVLNKKHYVDANALYKDFDDLFYLQKNQAVFFLWKLFLMSHNIFWMLLEKILWSNQLLILFGDLKKWEWSHLSSFYPVSLVHCILAKMTSAFHLPPQ